MSELVLSAFGEHLRNLRCRQGMSQEQLAFLSGLHRTYLGGLERGERNPTLLTLLKIARGLDITLIELLEINDVS